jgi:hypothetical protein
MKTYDQYEILEHVRELLNIFFNQHLRFEKSFLEHEYTADEIKQSCDDEITKFMIEKFGVDWEENEQAEWFYEHIGCDIRITAEMDGIELYSELNQA